MNSGQATDHWNRYAEDLELAASLGLNSYRFSIEWAKLEPKEGLWHEESFIWYVNLLEQCEKLRLLPMLTLHHFTLPQWMAEKGGFTSPDSVFYFTRFAEKVIERLGPRVPIWCTFNEPMVLLMGSYLGGFMPPAKNAPKLVGIASVHILEAHAKTYSLIHQISERSGPWSEWPLQVGIAHNMLDVLPDRWWHPIENLLAWQVNRFYNLSWLDAICGRRQHFGIPFLIPFPKQVKELKNRVTVDYLGINYYTKAYMKWRPRDSSEESLATIPVGIAFARRKEEQSDMGWAIHPSGFRKVLKKAASYKLPIYITENGIADREDRWRAKYMAQHLRELGKLIREGVDIRGFFYWSLLDNFEWIKGFGPRFGLFQVNYQNFQRTERSSAGKFREIIRSHGGTRAPDPDLLDSFCD